MKWNRIPAHIDLPFDKADKSPLTKRERGALAFLNNNELSVLHTYHPKHKLIRRLREPIHAYCKALNTSGKYKFMLTRYIFLHMASVGRIYWSWTADEWAALYTTQIPKQYDGFRYLVAALAYHCGGHIIIRKICSEKQVMYTNLACRMFGKARVFTAVEELLDTLNGIGYKINKGTDAEVTIRTTFAALMIDLGSPDAANWSEPEFISTITGPNYSHDRTSAIIRRGYRYAVWFALHIKGIIKTAPSFAPRRTKKYDAFADCSPEWSQRVQKYIETRYSNEKTMTHTRTNLLFAGLWAARYFPEASCDPQKWTAEIAAEYTRFVCHAKIGDLKTIVTANVEKRRGEPLTGHSKKQRLSAIRTYFEFLIENETIRRRFSPRSIFALPQSIATQTGPKPRDLEDDIWAKLLWAGLNLQEEDFGDNLLVRYPIEMLQAIAIVWLFAGLRSDELRRLVLHCLQWEFDLLESPSEGEVKPAICYLLVPANKYQNEFRKPVAGEVGKAIEAWISVRPHQPLIVDRKTKYMEEKLFSLRGRAIGLPLINTIIDSMCDKAGVPRSDAKGRITTHRARSTIATQLANAPEPMTPWELKEWLGHSHINSTQWYVNQRPQKLARRFLAADVWRTNLARIRVILDREAIENGSASAGHAYRYYDVGDGYCTDNFFSRCPHRMACAKCSYYVPKASTKGQLLAAAEANETLFAEIPLREEERAAMTADGAAVRELLQRLDDIPALDGRTPKEIRELQ